MKPKTRLQVEVWDLHKSLSEPREHEAFVISKHEFYYTTHYKNLVCLECNHKWKPSAIWHEQVIGVKCPSCDKNLKKITINNNLFERIITYQVTQVVGRFQVFRYFSCWKLMSKNKPPRYHFRSLFEEWCEYDKNKKVVVGRNPSWTGDGFSSSDYEVRYNKQPYFQQSAFDSYTSQFNCLGAEFLPRFRKYDLAKFNHNIDYRHLIENVARSSKVETLFKAKEIKLLEYSIKNDSKHNSYWYQIKIVIRNKYKVLDAGIWYDYLDLLRYFNKDIHNPKFVCPRNLKKEHDYWMRKKRIILDREAREREEQAVIRRQKKLEQAIVEYQQRNEKFFELFFAKENLTVQVLKTIEEFKEEGDELKHCVFTNEYYLKKNSLILSARLSGVRAETIEVDLKSFKILQSRGIRNNTTDYHDAIVQLVKSNISKIKKAMQEASKKEIQLTNKNQAA